MNKGQVTIWIILGIFLVAAMILFFMLGDKPEINVPPEEDLVFDMQGYLDICTQDSVEEVVDLVLLQGGFVDPVNYVDFNDGKVEYICENIGFYDPCIQQHPMLLQEIKEEIRKNVVTKVGRCFSDFEKEVRDRGGRIDSSIALPEVAINLGEDRLWVNIKKEVVISLGDETRQFKEFDFDLRSPVYNLAMIAMEIAAQEAEYCYFEYVGYHVLYPRYEIKPYFMSDPTVIYTIIDTKSEKSMNIAIRSCAIPAGV
ncbi:MAG: hypothetical protein ABIH92_04365 [Nanoarchaeota archaeon]